MGHRFSPPSAPQIGPIRVVISLYKRLAPAALGAARRRMYFTAERCNEGQTRAEHLAQYLPYTWRPAACHCDLMAHSKEWWPKNRPQEVMSMRKNWPICCSVVFHCADDPTVPALMAGPKAPRIVAFGNRETTDDVH